MPIDRVVWLRAYVAQLQRATAEGVPVRGWFHWSTMDNFEWIMGYQPKFGLFSNRDEHAEAHAEAECALVSRNGQA